MSDTRPGDDPAPHRARISARLVAGVVAVAAGVVLVVQNTEDVTVSFLGFEGSMPLWLFGVLMAAAGAVAGQVAGVVRRRRRDR